MSCSKPPKFPRKQRLFYIIPFIQNWYLLLHEMSHPQKVKNSLFPIKNHNWLDKCTLRHAVENKKKKIEHNWGKSKLNVNIKTNRPKFYDDIILWVEITQFNEHTTSLPVFITLPWKEKFMHNKVFCTFQHYQIIAIPCQRVLFGGNESQSQWKLAI